MLNQKDISAQYLSSHDRLTEPLDELWQNISPLYCIRESIWLKQLLRLAQPTEVEAQQAITLTTQFIERVRADKKPFI